MAASRIEDLIHVEEVPVQEFIDSVAEVEDNQIAQSFDDIGPSRLSQDQQAAGFNFLPSARNSDLLPARLTAEDVASIVIPPHFDKQSNATNSTAVPAIRRRIPGTSKRRAVENVSGAPYSDQVTKHSERDVDLGDWADTRPQSQIVNDCLRVEARFYASSLADKPAMALELLEKVQIMMARIQDALGQRVRFHGIMEVGAPESDDKFKTRHVIPIHSGTLIPAFHVDLLGSSVVAQSLCETLAIAEYVARSDGGIIFDPIDMAKKRKIVAKAPGWYPGGRSDHIEPGSPYALTISSFCSFTDDDDTSKAADEELRKLYEKMKTDGPLIVTSGFGEVAYEDPFTIAPSNRVLVHYCNPAVYEQISKLSEKALDEVWSSFFRALNKIAKKSRMDLSKGKISGPIVYERFTPPWLHGNVDFLIGRKHPKVVSVEIAKMPRLSDLKDSDGRILAVCILTVWIREEKESRDLLCSFLAQKDIVLDFDDIELAGLAGCDLITPASDLHRKFQKCVPVLGERDIVSFPGYRLSADEVHTLQPLRVPCTSTLDAFYVLLGKMSTGRAIVLPSSFGISLCKNDTATMMRWPLKDVFDKLDTATCVIVPLSNRETHHYGIAVVKRYCTTIDIIDSKSKAQHFKPIYPRLVRWYSVLFGRHGKGGWPTTPHIRERFDIESEHDMVVDSSIFAAAHAYNVVSYMEEDGVLARNINHIRAKMCDSIVKGKIMAIPTNNTLGETSVTRGPSRVSATYRVHNDYESFDAPSQESN